MTTGPSHNRQASREMALDHNAQLGPKVAKLSLKDGSANKIPPLIPRSQRRPGNSTAEPPPQTPPLPDPPALSSLSPTIPTRRILSPDDHEKFLHSSTNRLIQAWIFGLCDCVHGKSVGDIERLPRSVTLQNVDKILDVIEGLLEEYPPLDTGSRFGNPIFRSFHRAVIERAVTLHTELFSLQQNVAEEVATYLQNCLGSDERLDYGSGHELNFALWLLCLNRLDMLQQNEFPIVALHVFPRYWRLMRKIQSTYYLEPAGSHGVWGLDDYQFLPFLFGASQLVDHPYVTPRAIHNSVVLDEEGDKYLYLDQIRWVDSVKTVKGIRWHSPMLDDISSAKSWQKVEDGMKKMFVKEIIGKLPIMQHFLFGSLIPAAEGMGQLDPETLRIQAERMSHVKEHGHEPDYWGDCCGIKVPSTVAAGEEMRKRLGTAGGLRPIPFD